MLIPSLVMVGLWMPTSLSRRVNANSQLMKRRTQSQFKLIKKGEC